MFLKAGLDFRAALMVSAIYLLPASALAQENTPLALDASAASDDIVVTARRSEENIQSTPVSVTAFNSDMLRTATIQNTADLMIKTPGVFLGGSGSRENSVFVIRGQSKALSGSNAPAVVSYFADVPQPTFSSGLAVYDMASVQVLKGPQGTLFGRNTTGGAVLFYPTAPTYDVGGYLQLGYGRFDNRQLEGALTIPIVRDKISLRLAGQYQKRDGYTKNIGIGGDFDDINSRAFRASLLIEPVEGVKNLTIFDYYRNSYNGDGTVLFGVVDQPGLIDLLGLREATLAELARQRVRGPRVVDNDVSPTISRTRRLGVTNRTDIDLSDSMSFTNIFGYRRTTGIGNYNVDGLPLLTSTGNPEIGLPAGVRLTFINGGSISRVEQFTDEIQLKGDAFGDRINWLLGGFYLKSRPFGPTGGGNSVGQPPLPGQTYPQNFPTYNYAFYRETSRALFGNVNINLDDILSGLRLNAGIRYTWDKESSCTATDLSTGGTLSEDICVEGTDPRLIIPTVNRAKSNAPTWTLGFDWQATQKLFTYLVTRRGYRSGGINTPTFGGNLLPYQSFGPERVTDVEAGIRSDWDVGGVKVRLNASAFVGYYDGVQIALSGVRTNPGCTVGAPVLGQPPYSPDGDCDPNNDPQSGTLLVNAGKARIAGLDFDGRISPTSRLSFTFGGNFLDPKTRSFNAPAVFTAYLGSREIPFDLVAKRTITLGAQYRLPLGDNVGELNFSADYYASSKLPYVDTYLPSYDVVNMRLDWNDVGARPLDLSVYMTNVFDKKYLQAGTVSGDTVGINAGIYGAPRQFGLTLRYRFGER